MSIRTEMEKMKKDSDDAMKRLAHIESENEKIVSAKHFVLKAIQFNSF